MTSTRFPFVRSTVISAFCAATLWATPAAGLAQHSHDTAEATPATTWSCDTIATPAAAATPSGHADHGMAKEAPFDQLYLDMMLPHHGSVIALAQAALAHLTDPRLVDIAEAIIAAQTDENAMLTGWRTAWYGAGQPDTSEAAMMQMLDAMPVATMDDMMRQMDPAAQVSAFCSASDPDLAFIDQVIPHHQMAVDVSVIAVGKAEHPELVTFAEGVIANQQAEIDELTGIRNEIGATPAA